MKLKLWKSLVLGFFLSFLFMAGGCVPALKTIHPQFDVSIKEIKTIGFPSPDIKIYDFTAGGVRELRDDWSAMGKENVQKAVMECLRETPFIIKPITIDKDLEEEMGEIYALYRAVSKSILLHTQGENKFPEKEKNFDYSIGSLEKILKKYEVDALIFVTGFDEISSTGRQALKAVGIIAGIAATAAGIGGVVFIPRSGITLVDVAIVDPSGSILWYNSKASEGGYDLRNFESAMKFLRDILSEFPGAKK